MSDERDPVTSPQGSPDDRSMTARRSGGSVSAGVALGVALGLLAPLALMSQHLGTLFGGEITLYRVVLAEFVIPIVVWIVVGIVLIAREPWRRMGIGVLVAGGIPALVLMVLVLPWLLPGALTTP